VGHDVGEDLLADVEFPAVEGGGGRVRRERVSEYVATDKKIVYVPTTVDKAHDVDEESGSGLVGDPSLTALNSDVSWI
jgi:hypothetical protein